MFGLFQWETLFLHTYWLQKMTNILLNRSPFFFFFFFFNFLNIHLCSYLLYLCWKLLSCLLLMLKTSFLSFAKIISVISSIFLILHRQWHHTFCPSLSGMLWRPGSWFRCLVLSLREMSQCLSSGTKMACCLCPHLNILSIMLTLSLVCYWWEKWMINTEGLTLVWLWIPWAVLNILLSWMSRVYIHILSLIRV